MWAGGAWQILVHGVRLGPEALAEELQENGKGLENEKQQQERKVKKTCEYSAA